MQKKLEIGDKVTLRDLEVIGKAGDSGLVSCKFHGSRVYVPGTAVAHVPESDVVRKPRERFKPGDRVLAVDSDGETYDDDVRIVVYDDYTSGLVEYINITRSVPGITSYGRVKNGTNNTAVVFKEEATRLRKA